MKFKREIIGRIRAYHLVKKNHSAIFNFVTDYMESKQTFGGKIQKFNMV